MVTPTSHTSPWSSSLRPDAPNDPLVEGLLAAEWGEVRTYPIDFSTTVPRCASPLTPLCHPPHGRDEYEYWSERLQMLFQDVQGHYTNNDFKDRRRWIGDGEYWQIEAEHWRKLFEDFHKHLSGQSLSIPSKYQFEEQQLKIDTEWGRAIVALHFREAYEALNVEHLERLPGRAIGSSTLALQDHRARISDRLLYQIAARHWEILCKDITGTYACLKAIIGVQDFRETIRNSFYWRTEFNALNYLLQKLNRVNSEPSSNHDNLCRVPNSTNLQLLSKHGDYDQEVNCKQSQVDSEVSMGHGFDQEVSVVSAMTGHGYEAGTEMTCRGATRLRISRREREATEAV